MAACSDEGHRGRGRDEALSSAVRQLITATRDNRKSFKELAEHSDHNAWKQMPKEKRKFKCWGRKNPKY